MANVNNTKSNHSKKYNNIYTKSLITRKIMIPIKNINDNLIQTFKTKIKSEIEGKCIVNGYIKPDSIEISTYTMGILQGSNVEFEVLFECLICNPVEGMIINCIVKNITKAGIRAEINEEISPLVIFISRDHHYILEKFSNIVENQEIRAKIIGQRFELNDKYISVIAELVEMKNTKSIKEKKKPKLILDNE